jgi:serine/threonine-protein phosphatase 5
MIERFKNGKKIAKKYAFQIVRAAKEIAYDEPTMVEIGVDKGAKLTVCGDTHGMVIKRPSNCFRPDMVF